ncbi:MAG: hypothetical protein DHS20C13_30810 [Thermodesulfobacteriota bacterium]|nr:MAG: hypothetical protein DHS20C13_30810 [Thermodesulfobacteriota bacterium]
MRYLDVKLVLKDNIILKEILDVKMVFWRKCNFIGYFEKFDKNA